MAQHFSIGKLMIGLTLLAVGVVTFLETIDVWDSGSLWSYWPVILIALGAAGEIDAIRQRKSDGSIFVLGIGVWMFAGAFGLFGLSYGEAMPLAVVIVGLGVMLHAVIDRPEAVKETKENAHERQQ